MPFLLLFLIVRVAQRDPIGAAFIAYHGVNPSTDPREYTAFDAEYHCISLYSRQ